MTTGSSLTYIDLLSKLLIADHIPLSIKRIFIEERRKMFNDTYSRPSESCRIQDLEYLWKLLFDNTQFKEKIAYLGFLLVAPSDIAVINYVRFPKLARNLLHSSLDADLKERLPASDQFEIMKILHFIRKDHRLFYLSSVLTNSFQSIRQMEDIDLEIKQWWFGDFSLSLAQINLLIKETSYNALRDIDHAVPVKTNHVSTCLNKVLSVWEPSANALDNLFASIFITAETGVWNNRTNCQLKLLTDQVILNDCRLLLNALIPTSVFREMLEWLSSVKKLMPDNKKLPDDLAQLVAKLIRVEDIGFPYALIYGHAGHYTWRSKSELCELYNRGKIEEIYLPEYKDIPGVKVWPTIEIPLRTIWNRPPDTWPIGEPCSIPEYFEIQDRFLGSGVKIPHCTRPKPYQCFPYFMADLKWYYSWTGDCSPQFATFVHVHGEERKTRRWYLGHDSSMNFAEPSLRHTTGIKMSNFTFYYFLGLPIQLNRTGPSVDSSRILDDVSKFNNVQLLMRFSYKGLCYSQYANGNALITRSDGEPDVFLACANVRSIRITSDALEIIPGPLTVEELPSYTTYVDIIMTSANWFPDKFGIPVTTNSKPQLCLEYWRDLGHMTPLEFKPLKLNLDIPFLTVEAETSGNIYSGTCRIKGGLSQVHDLVTSVAANTDVSKVDFEAVEGKKMKIRSECFNYPGNTLDSPKDIVIENCKWFTNGKQHQGNMIIEVKTSTRVRDAYRNLVEHPEYEIEDRKFLLIGLDDLYASNSLLKSKFIKALGTIGQMMLKLRNDAENSALYRSVIKSTFELKQNMTNKVPVYDRTPRVRKRFYVTPSEKSFFDLECEDIKAVSKTRYKSEIKEPEIQEECMLKQNITMYEAPSDVKLHDEMNIGVEKEIINNAFGPFAHLIQVSENHMELEAADWAGERANKDLGVGGDDESDYDSDEY